ncbi:MAG: amidophosphoribosyltransferase [Oligoflexia bacterium]|nr:amidophosphoribosyltransferase [Oligoflexia bacterium]
MCGIVGLIGTPHAAREAFLGLTTLQHRGQDAAGILSYDADGFHRVKNIGLVESVFTRENMATLTGNAALGHARYATIGRGDVGDVQPFVLSYPYGLGIAHNGNIVNTEAMAAELRTRSRRLLMTRSDTEIILNLLADGLARATRDSEVLTFDHLCAAVGELCQRLNGSYSVVALIAGHGLMAFRDPHGIRPLIWGRRSVADAAGASPGSGAQATGMPGTAGAAAEGTLPSGEAHMVASESVALEFQGYEIVRDLKPGELLYIDQEGQVHSRVLDARPERHCMFEWVYFASPESRIDGIPVYGARIELGRSLARLLKSQLEERGLAGDVIVPVPETSRIAAIALAEELAIPYREVLIKNRYIKRTFILDSQEKRQSAVNLKLSPVRSEIQGKRVILVDDSIVRGTTSKKIIELVRQAGASRVIFVSTCPPIQHPCYYGIDFPVESELIASGRSNREIEEALGADAVVYQDVEGLRSSLGRAKIRAAHDRAGAGEGQDPELHPCMACLDGKYPTDVSACGARLAAARKADRVTNRGIK